MQYWNNKNNFFLFLFIFIVTYKSQAQENSPYSRYGIGNIRDIENISNRGMGGVSIADDNPLSLNPTNPATYADLALATYQVGLTAHFATLKSTNASNKVGKSTLAYVNIGFPISKKMGFSFGLLPVSSVRYNMQKTDSNVYVQSLVNNSYYGGGGVQKVYVGTAYKIKDFSVGVNGGYQFGNISNSTESSFTDSLDILSNNVYGRTILGGFFWQAGVLMNTEIKKDYRLKIGATYTGRQTVNERKETYWESYFKDIDNVVNRADSAVNIKGKMKLPMQARLGLMLSHADNWQIGADFTYADWKNYTSFGNRDSTDNSWMVKLGGSYVPDPASVNNYWKRTVFRLGFYTGKDIFSFSGNQLNRMGGTFGIGYPLRRSTQNRQFGTLNFSLDIGTRGETTNNLLKENYTHISFGITFNDKWFLKRKYD